MAEFFHGICHRKDVFRGNVIHYSLNGGYHANPAESKNLNYTLNFPAHILNTGVRQDVMCVDASAKKDISTESFLE